MDLHLKTIVYVLTVSIPVTFLFGCSSEKQQTEPTTQITTSTELELIAADLSPIKSGTLTQSKPFTGTIQPINQSSVQAQVSATALQVFFDIGKYVQKGQILVRLNNQDNSARLVQAQANLAAAKAEAELNRSVMQRKSNLLQQGFISKLEYEQSQLEYRAQQENVKVMQANVDIAQKAAQDTVITSPISGYITNRQVDVGQTVAIGQTLFEIVDSHQIELKAQISTSDQQYLKIGQKLNFNLQGNPTQYQATITRISPVANQINRSIEFYAKPENHIDQLSIGSFVEGQLIENTSQSGQIIPLKSVYDVKDAAHVWVVREHKLIKVPVQILQLDQRQELALIQGLLTTDQVSLVKFDEQDINKTVRLQ